MNIFTFIILNKRAEQPEPIKPKRFMVGLDWIHYLTRVVWVEKINNPNHFVESTQSNPQTPPSCKDHNQSTQNLDLY